MSSLKSGRRKKILNLKCSNIVPTEFDSARFASVLLKLGGDPSKWSLRKEWILFHQTYFSTSSSRLKQARSCYDFYRRHLVKADGGGTSMSDNVNDVNLMGDFIPRSHLDENDSVMPRGNTNVANVDNIVRDACAENIFCEAHTGVNSNDDDDNVFTCDDGDVNSLKNVDYLFPGDTNNDANNKVTHPDCVISISPSRVSADIEHPSHETSNLDPSTSPVSKPVSIDTSKGGKKETIIFPRLEQMENSIIIINSTAGEAELDRLARISNTSGKSQGNKDAMPSKVSNELNRESATINKSHCTEKSELRGVPVIALFNEQTGKNQVEHFTIPATTSLPFPSSHWHGLFSRRVINEQNGSERLPPDWRGIFAEAQEIPFLYCCINFKRHKLYKVNSQLLFKCWYYCIIEGCELRGTASLDASHSLVLQNANTDLCHVKNRPNSFKARNVTGEERKSLGESVKDMSFPSKVYHRRVAALDETTFNMGNLKNVPQSKTVIAQCKYEYRKDSRIDNSVIVSLKELKNIYIKEFNSKVIPGFIQFTSLDPLTVSLWCEKDRTFSPNDKETLFIG